MEDWTCTHCGEVTSRPTWLAVDAPERPDLIEQLATLIEFECPRCLHPVRRSQPLLVLRLARSAPLVAVPGTDEGGEVKSLGGVVATVRRELHDALDEVLEHPAIVTLDELEAGVHEDIDSDIEAFEGSANGGVAYNPAYRWIAARTGLAVLLACSNPRCVATEDCTANFRAGGLTLDEGRECSARGAHHSESMFMTTRSCKAGA